MIRILCIAALLTCAPAAVGAQGPGPTCDDARTQADMNRCAGRALQKEDSLLNAVYPEVISALDPAAVGLLREAQRQWIRFRDAECLLQAGDVEGGSMYAMVHASCLAGLTRQRVEQLSQMLPHAARAAEQRFEVTETARDLFAAMQQKDTAELRRLMHPRAQIVAVGDNGVTVRTADEWIRALSRNPDVLIERMWDAQVEIEGNLATLWAPYDFHLGGRFSHCGTDAFQFVREGMEWKMIAITFTRRTAGCEAPL